MPQFERRLYEPTEDGQAFDSDEDIEDEGSRLPLLIGIALIVLLSFAGVVWLAYTQGVQRGRADAPRIVASADVASADRKPTPYSKLKIYQAPKADEDVASEDPAPAPSAVTPPDLSTSKSATPAAKSETGSAAPKTAAETSKSVSPSNANTASPIQQPATGAPRVITPAPTNAKPAKAAPPPIKAPAAKTTPAPVVPKSNGPGTATQKAAATKPSSSVPIKTASAKAAVAKTAAIVPPPTKAASDVASKPKQATKVAAITPAPTPPTTAPSTTAVAAPKEAPAKTSAGGFLLQIGSYKSDAEANASWQTYKGAHESVAGYSPDVRKVELGAKGTWYRLRVGPFASLSEANAACAKLKAQGGNCFPAKQ